MANYEVWVCLTGFLGLQYGWYLLQQKYVPPHERHEHPVVRLYQNFVNKKKEKDSIDST